MYRDMLTIRGTVMYIWQPFEDMFCNSYWWVASTYIPHPLILEQPSCLDYPLTFTSKTLLENAERPNIACNLSQAERMLKHSNVERKVAEVMYMWQTFGVQLCIYDNLSGTMQLCIYGNHSGTSYVYMASFWGPAMYQLLVGCKHIYHILSFWSKLLV